MQDQNHWKPGEFIAGMARNMVEALAIVALSALIVSMITGCASTPKPEPPIDMTSRIDGLQCRQSTISGVSVYSASGISAERLTTIDEKFAWCIANGLNIVLTETILYVQEPDWFNSDGGWITAPDGQHVGGRTISKSKPTVIMVMPHQLGCIRHECLHIYLFQTTGDSDHDHLLKKFWYKWSDYSMT